MPCPYYPYYSFRMTRSLILTKTYRHKGMNIFIVLSTETLTYRIPMESHKDLHWKCSKVEKHSAVSVEIFNTRATLKLLTPPWRFGHWTKKHFAHGRVKRADWNGRKREKVGQLCPSTETGAVQGWAVVESRCQLYSFNQSINDCTITKNKRLTKKRSQIKSYQ